MRRFGWRLLIGMCFGVCMMAVWPATGGESNLLHAIIAVVNGNRITQSDLNDAAMYLIRRRYGEQVPRITPEEKEALSEAAIRELIKMHLIQDEAKVLELEVSRSQVNEQLQRMQFVAATASAMARKFAEAEVLFDEIMSKLGRPRPMISPRDVLEFWKEHKNTVFRQKRLVIVRHIFMGTVVDSPETVRVKANAVWEKILAQPKDKRAEFFAEAAKNFSQDRFAEGGGLLRLGPNPDGWFIQEFPNQTREGTELFPEAMYQGIQGLVQAGDVTPLIRSEKGFHILYLEDAKGGQQIPFDQAQKRIEFHLQQKIRQDRLLEWLTDKLKRSRVTWNDGEPYPADKILPKALVPQDVMK